MINSSNSWAYYMSQGEHYAVANTPNGRIYLKDFIMNTPEDMVTKYIDHNTLDNRKCNLNRVSITEEFLEEN